MRCLIFPDKQHSSILICYERSKKNGMCTSFQDVIYYRSSGNRRWMKALRKIKLIVDEWYLAAKQSDMYETSHINRWNNKITQHIFIRTNVHMGNQIPHRKYHIYTHIPRYKIEYKTRFSFIRWSLYRIHCFYVCCNAYETTSLKICLPWVKERLKGKEGHHLWL